MRRRYTEDEVDNIVANALQNQQDEFNRLQEMEKIKSDIRDLTERLIKVEEATGNSRVGF